MASAAVPLPSAPSATRRAGTSVSMASAAVPLPRPAAYDYTKQFLMSLNGLCGRAAAEYQYRRFELYRTKGLNGLCGSAAAEDLQQELDDR